MSSSTAFLEELSRAIKDTDWDLQPTRANVFRHTSFVLMGNGGSNAICLHAAADLMLMGFDARCLSESPVLTALSNDRGYVHAFENQIEALPYAATVIAVSSSGRSPNILYAAKVAKERKFNVITFTGMDPDNRLRQIGHLNCYVPSFNYGIVECAHMAILHSIIKP